MKDSGMALPGYSDVFPGGAGWKELKLGRSWLPSLREVDTASQLPR